VEVVQQQLVHGAPVDVELQHLAVRAQHAGQQLGPADLKWFRGAGRGGKVEVGRVACMQGPASRVQRSASWQRPPPKQRPPLPTARRRCLGALPALPAGPSPGVAGSGWGSGRPPALSGPRAAAAASCAAARSSLHSVQAAPTCTSTSSLASSTSSSAAWHSLTSCSLG
jgi:hypothetical protein